MTGIAPTIGGRASPGGFTGATAAVRFAGGTTSGAPTTGTFAVGDFVVTNDGQVFVCVTAGSPGTWTAASKSRDQIRTEGLGYKSWTFPNIGTGSGATALASQVLRGAALGLKAGDVITNLIVQTTVAAGGTAGSVLAGLYSSAYGKLVVTADVQAALTATAGLITLPLTAPFTITVDGVYFPVIDLVTVYGTTQPSLLSASAGTSPPAFSTSPMPSFAQTSQATLPTTITPATSGIGLWFAVN